MRGVKRLLGGVEFVEHGTDEGGLAHVLRDADPLGVSGARNGHVAAVGEADRCRVEGHGAETLGCVGPAAPRGLACRPGSLAGLRQRYRYRDVINGIARVRDRSRARAATRRRRITLDRDDSGHALPTHDSDGGARRDRTGVACLKPLSHQAKPPSARAGHDARVTTPACRALPAHRRPRRPRRADRTVSAVGAVAGAPLRARRRVAGRPHAGRVAGAAQSDRPLRPAACGGVQLVCGADDRRRAQTLLPRLRLVGAGAARPAGARAARAARKRPVRRRARSRPDRRAARTAPRRRRRADPGSPRGGRRAPRRVTGSPARGRQDDERPVRELGVEDPGFAAAEDAATVSRLAALLSERDREVLRLRFEQDLTQSEIGARIGCSQMHVSRILRGAIARLQAQAGAELAAAA